MRIGRRIYRAVVLIFFVLGMSLAMSAGTSTSGYQTAKLLDARLTATNNGMGGQTYELLVQLGNLIIVCSQAGKPWGGFLPWEFVINGPVEIRFEGRRLALRRPNGKEIKARILRQAIVENDNIAAALESKLEASDPDRVIVPAGQPNLSGQPGVSNLPSEPNVMTGPLPPGVPQAMR
jgi:hypothetical protein